MTLARPADEVMRSDRSRRRCSSSRWPTCWSAGEVLRLLGAADHHCAVRQGGIPIGSGCGVPAGPAMGRDRGFGCTGSPSSASDAPRRSRWRRRPEPATCERGEPDERPLDEPDPMSVDAAAMPRAGAGIDTGRDVRSQRPPDAIAGGCASEQRDRQISAGAAAPCRRAISTIRTRRD